MKKRTYCLAVILLSFLTAFSQSPVKYWSFDNQPENIEGKYRMVNGVKGMALKLDGFSTVISEYTNIEAILTSSFTIEGWVAMAAYPWNWCPVLTQMKEESGGFSFEIGPRGELALKMHVSKNIINCISDETIPLRAWTHIAAIYEEGVGVRLFLNGNMVAEYQTKGKPSYAPKEELRVGMNYTAVFPSNRIGENGITPYWFSLDCILDELKVYDGALKSDAIMDKVSAVNIANLPAPEIDPRHLPRVESTGEFQAYYTKLKYYPEWDEQWPVGPDPDIVVTFKDSPVKLIFWRGTRFSPAWVTDNHLWMCDQSVETWNDEEGCKEHMQDRHCRYSHVRIIENTPARKIIHWRYAPVSAYNTLWTGNEKAGWGVWIDEYYYIYPDAAAIRKITWKTDYFGHPRQFQETIPLTEPGQLRKEVMEIDYLKVANLEGDQMPLFYAENPRKQTDLEIISDPNIQQHNFKSAYDPFIIFEPGNNMNYIADRAIRNLDFPGSCNHWPVGQAYCDGRVTQAADRPASFLGFPISDPLVHDEADGRSYVASLYGMKSSSIEELVEMAKTWAQAPKMTIDPASGFSGGEYAMDERAYQIKKTGKSSTLKIQVDASEKSPFINPAIVIENWGKKSISVEVNGKSLKEGKDYSVGYDSRLEGTDLIIWIKLNTNKKQLINIYGS